jgi:hypothetical protein
VVISHDVHIRMDNLQLSRVYEVTQCDPQASILTAIGFPSDRHSPTRERADTGRPLALSRAFSTTRTHSITFTTEVGSRTQKPALFRTQFPAGRALAEQGDTVALSHPSATVVAVFFIFSSTHHFPILLLVNPILSLVSLTLVTASSSPSPKACKRAASTSNLSFCFRPTPGAA